MFVYTIQDILSLAELILLVGLFLVLIILIIIGFIKYKIESLYKKDCSECKHYKLHDVASFGDRCTYKCLKTGKTYDFYSVGGSRLEKCDLFEKKGENQ